MAPEEIGSGDDLPRRGPERDALVMSATRALFKLGEVGQPTDSDTIASELTDLKRQLAQLTGDEQLAVFKQVNERKGLVDR